MDIGGFADGDPVRTADDASLAGLAVEAREQPRIGGHCHFP
jgi:hypothetical protein